MARPPSFATFLYILRLLFLVCCTKAYATVSNDTLKAIPGPGDDFNINTGALLSPILVPRVAGTPGSLQVLNHFIDFFKGTLPKWNISLQNSTSRTPATGDREVPFVNMIASLDPPWTQPGEVGRLTLVAHYDSKLTPAGFIGATDSAAPCAMLMHTARSLDAALSRKWAAMKAEGAGSGGYSDFEEQKGIQILFLDGEEAFVSWTNEDSLYGARSLAAEWEAARHPALSTFHTAISSISLFVLLDLLGDKNPTVPSYFKTTHWAYQKMAALETRLRDLSLFKSSPNHPSKRILSTEESEQGEKRRRGEPLFLTDANKDHNRWMGGMVLDDHVPFMARGVDVLHIIPTPFPRVWHEMDDDGEHLDLDSVEDWALLTTAFAAEWMELDGFFNSAMRDKKPMGRKGRQVISKTEL